MKAEKKLSLRQFTGQAVFVLLLLSIFLTGCSSGGETSGPADIAEFEDYWFRGEAELTRYELRQARYGEIRKGDAVLIFVTEDFLAGKQVKREDYSREYKDSVPVLKLNAVRKFETGIYPYSLMTSVFSPIDLNKFPHALKITTTVQEWCGHVFMQLNARRNKYEVNSFSYFQQEGDRHYKIDKVYTEEEIWTRIRIAPDSLPTGDIRIIPGTLYTRLKHRTLKPRQAIASKTDGAGGESVSGPGKGDLVIYTIEYREETRKLSIHYTRDFPHTIEYFEEEYPSGFGNDARIMKTTARKTHRIMAPYWQLNGTVDAERRLDLGLPVR